MSNASQTKLEQLQQRIGEEIGVSPWVAIEQSRINQFAEATGDHQWIHVDVERAAKECPFGSTIAHGYLTLSLAAPALFDTVLGPLQAASVINYGLEKVRFVAPVPAGKRVRYRVKLLALEAKGKGTLMTTELTAEIEGADKPALIAQSLVLVLA